MTKLEVLTRDWGYEDLMEMLEEATYDSVCPGICTKPGCSYSTEVEPDQSHGWCEACQSNSVASALVLAGMI